MSASRRLVAFALLLGLAAAAGACHGRRRPARSEDAAAAVPSGGASARGALLADPAPVDPARVAPLAARADSAGEPTTVEPVVATEPPPPAPSAGASLDDAVRAALRDAGVRTPSVERDRPELVHLGRALFFDKVLSGNRNIACATCHTTLAGTGDGLPVSLGEGALGAGHLRVGGPDTMIPRNAPALFNAGVAGVDSLFWDRRVARDPKSGGLRTPEPGLNGPRPALAAIAAQLPTVLEAQAMFPVTSPEEMRGDPGDNELADAKSNLEVWDLLMGRLVGEKTARGGRAGGIDGYRTLFAAAYPETDAAALNFGHAARAIAAFERTAFVALDTPLDRYLAGDASALSERQKRGALLFFGEAGCGGCHGGPLLSDLDFHATAAPQIGPGRGGEKDDRGWGLLTGRPEHDYAFRTPPLRNVALTAPYTHAGAFADLEGIVRHYIAPSKSLLAYDPSQLREDFAATARDFTAKDGARIEALDPLLIAETPLEDAEVEAIVDFLHALTDPGSLDLGRVAPSSVPSGLPVFD